MDVVRNKLAASPEMTLSLGDEDIETSEWLQISHISRVMYVRLPEKVQKPQQKHLISMEDGRNHKF